MNTSESIAKLAPALIKAQGAMKAVEKTNSNDFHRYTYADLGDIKRTVDGPLQDNGLALVVSEPEVVAGAPRETKGGKASYPVRVRIVGRLIHESGEWIESEMWGEGQDGEDKAIYKATTGARKYLLTSMFHLATTDDPEADDEKPKQRQQQRSLPRGQGDRPKPPPRKQQHQDAEGGPPASEKQIAFLRRLRDESGNADLKERIQVVLASGDLTVGKAKLAIDYALKDKDKRVEKKGAGSHREESFEPKGQDEPPPPDDEDLPF